MDGMRQMHACMRRFKYSQEFLQWALQPPGWQSEWVLGVRVSTSGKLVAFITGRLPCSFAPSLSNTNSRLLIMLMGSNPLVTHPQSFLTAI